MKKLVILAVLLSIGYVLPGCANWFGKKDAPAEDNMATSNVALPAGNDALQQPYTPPPSNTANVGGPVVGPTKSTPSHNEAGTYTVKQGDTLFKIAREQLGGNAKARDIKKANPDVTDWDHLKVGQVIKLPTK